MMNTKLVGKFGILGAATLLFALGACNTDTGSDEDSTETSAGDGDGDPAGDGDGDTAGDGDGDTAGDGDGDTAGDGDGDTAGDGDGDAMPSCEESHAPGEGAADGESCLANEDCASKLCEVFQDAPPVEGSCQPAPEACETRVMGRVLDFSTRAEVAGASLRAVSALDASQNPINSPGVATATSDDAGVFDVLSDGQITAPIGLVGLVEADTYYLTATGLASPVDMISAYGPANTIRDLWVVPAQLLMDWTGMLMPDAEFEDFLPLGEAGGVVGFARDPATGEPVVGVTIVSVAPENSNAKIRYLNEAGDGFTTEMTASSGVFVIAGPSLGESFNAEVGGVVQGDPGRAGSTNGGIFTLIMDIP